MNDSTNAQDANVTTTLRVDSVPDLEFIWMPQGPKTKVGLVMVKLAGTDEQIATFHVDAIMDQRETLVVAQGACRLFAYGYATDKYKAS